MRHVARNFGSCEMELIDVSSTHSSCSLHLQCSGVTIGSVLPLCFGLQYSASNVNLSSS